QAGEIHHEVALRRARRDEQVRAALLDVVLTTDSSIGAAFWDAAAQLGIPRDGRFVVVQVTDTRDRSPDAEPPPDLEARIVRLASVEGAWFRVGPRSQAGLICLRTAAKTGTDSELWRTLLGQPSLVAGVSAGYSSLSGTPRARAQSQVAAAAVSRRRRLVQYD